LLPRVILTREGDEEAKTTKAIARTSSWSWWPSVATTEPCCSKHPRFPDWSKQQAMRMSRQEPLAEADNVPYIKTVEAIDDLPF